jgi:heme oxygenase (biliverdin-producing, ferredoxin)
MGNRKMETLKELTKEQHKNAERSIFVKKMLKKELTAYQYYVYMANQYVMYDVLERHANKYSIFEGIEEVKRTAAILKDLEELEQRFGFEIISYLKSTDSYVDHIEQISNDSDKILAHVYVRHMGDLSGGQIIKKLIPAGSGFHYQFDGDINQLKTKIRDKLHNDLADEARVCFDMIKNFMEELEVFLDLESIN